jgi:hypothetical protein
MLGMTGVKAYHDAEQHNRHVTVKSFTSGRIRKAEHHASTKQLDLHFDNGSVLAYKHVPDEVFRRLCSAPNPMTYWEDRIAEEYPKGTPVRSDADGDGGKKWSDLFGGAGGD